MPVTIYGVDHGYGRMKTAHCNFMAGVSASAVELPYTDRVLKYEDKWYEIGSRRLPYRTDKTQDNSYYILTLAALAQEMRHRGVHTAQVHLAAGVPLTRFGRERAAFQKYLQQKKEISFFYEGEHYHVKLVNVDMFAQGMAALIYYQTTSKNKIEDNAILADLGSGTMEVAYLQNRKPVNDKSYSINCGMTNCYNKINEQLRRKFGKDVEEGIIDSIMLGHPVRIKEEYWKVIEEGLNSYAEEIYAQLSDLRFNLDAIPVYWIGGGAILMQRYGDLDPDMNIFVLEPSANAIGYELSAKALQAKAKAAEKAAKETGKK